MAGQKRFSEIGLKILNAAQAELFLQLPYLRAPLGSLRFQDGTALTAFAATDGSALFYNGVYLAERYLRGSAEINRLCLHVLFHCLFRHLGKRRGRDEALWDLACDAAAESVLDSLDLPCAGGKNSNPARTRFYARCRQASPVLTAEAIYRFLLRNPPGEYELAALARTFFADDHRLWNQAERDGNRRQDAAWQRMAVRTLSAMGTLRAGQSFGGAAVQEQVKAAARDDTDYRAFLRRFAAPRETPEIDGDGFDYIYYTYGLSHYGNLPLIEPPETREAPRIEDLVIAIDTSMSTSGAVVRQFLSFTCGILRASETFTHRFRIHVLQCDDQVRTEACLRSSRDLAEFQEHLSLCGGGATDFRPVFAHVASLRKAGTLSSLRGLIYFTDGMGVYPRQRTDYETAFVYPEEPPDVFPVPPWCTRVILGEEGLERAEQDTAAWSDWEADDMPEL